MVCSHHLHSSERSIFERSPPRGPITGAHPPVSQALVAAKTLGQTGVHVMSKGALGWSARSDRIHLSRFIKAGCLTLTVIHEDEYQVSWRVVAIV